MSHLTQPLDVWREALLACGLMAKYNSHALPVLVRIVAWCYVSYTSLAVCLDHIRATTWCSCFIAGPSDIEDGTMPRNRGVRKWGNGKPSHDSVLQALSTFLFSLLTVHVYEWQEIVKLCFNCGNRRRRADCNFTLPLMSQIVQIADVSTCKMSGEWCMGCHLMSLWCIDYARNITITPLPQHQKASYTLHQTACLNSSL